MSIFLSIWIVSSIITGIACMKAVKVIYDGTLQVISEEMRTPAGKIAVFISFNIITLIPLFSIPLAVIVLIGMFTKNNKE